MKINYKTKTGKIVAIDEDKEIHRGGEGRIILFNSQYVAKIYHPGINPISESEFTFLSKLDKNLFVCPEELLYDSRGTVVGFLMQYLGQDYFPLSTLSGKTFCISNNIDEKVKVKIAKNLTKAIEYAHSQNVIIGDLNHFNVLVNNQGDIRLIDTDSYEVSGHPHSGILLDDIRDYLYQGKVTKTSDFFALSVLIFNFLTYVHPFKGIHKKVKMLSERMINKLPVFCGDPDLIIPKCYEPIQNASLHQQFEKLYVKGERFMIALDPGAVMVKTLPRVNIKPMVQKDLIVSNILVNSSIREIFFTEEMGLVKTDTHYHIYDTKNHGYVTKKHELPISSADSLYITNKSIIGKKGNRMVYYSDGFFQEITNFDIPSEALFYQQGNILIVVGENDMFWLYMDEILAGNIKTRRTPVFGKGFRNYKGMVQNAGGVQYIFYNSGSDICTVRTDLNILSLFQNKNFGVVQYKEKNKTRYRFFRIDNLSLVLANEDIEILNSFAYKPSNSKNGFIFHAADNSISILRTEDFQRVSSIECDLISSAAEIQYCNAGIVAWEGENCWLLNKK